MITKEELCRLLAAMSDMREDGSWNCPNDLLHVIDELESETPLEFMEWAQNTDLKECVRSHAERLCDNIAVNNNILRKMREIMPTKGSASV